MDSPFTDSEKRFVLAEMIKVGHVDIVALVDFVKSYGLQPDWLSMQLPNGRNMNQCMRAADAMGMAYLQPPIMPPMKRKSLGDLNEPLPKRIAFTPIEHNPTPYPRNVNIQPRPSLNGLPLPPPAPSPTVPQAVMGRKRGRPSKAEKEAQARANAAGNAHLAQILAPAPQPPPLAPHPAPPPPAAAAQDFVANTPPSYKVSPSPVDGRAKRRGGRAASTDTSQPRRLPESPLEQIERTPVPTQATPGPAAAATRDNPAVQEAGRRLVASPIPTSTATSPLEHIRKGSHTPISPVHTRA